MPVTRPGERTDQDREWLIGNFSQSSTLVAVLGDLGFATTAHGNVDRTMVGGGIQRSVSALDTISIVGDLDADDLRSRQQRNTIFRFIRDRYLAPPSQPADDGIGDVPG